MTKNPFGKYAKRAPVVASYGGGTNSTALLIRWVREQRSLDLVLFADTGGERPETYEYTSLFSDWLAANGAPRITVVWYTNRSGDFVSLEADCLRKQTLPSKAFGYSGCSLKWKAEPQEKYINNWWPARQAWGRGDRVVKLLGFDADEPHRATRREQQDAVDPKYAYQYPLISWDFGRDECVEEIRKAGLPQPGKSSCFFCPSMKKPEIAQLKADRPALLERALHMERTAVEGDRGLDSVKGLGRSFSWSAFVNGGCAIGRGASAGGDAPVDTACGCYDG